MRFKQFKAASLIFLAAVLAACGGGGGSNSDSGFNPPGARATATAQSASVPAGSATDISVRITEASGAAVRDGIVVTGSVSPSSVGSVFGVDGSGGITQLATATTAGGNANFRFVGQQPGTATVSFTAADPNTSGRTVTASVTITVTEGTPRISMQATRTTIPINTYNIQPFFGSPYMSEVTITVRDSAGNAVSQPDGVQVSINPVGPAGFSTLDDPETEDINEFFVIMGQAPVNLLAGKATVFVHSENQTGTSVLTAATQDPVTGQTFSASLTFNFVATLPEGPEEIFVSHPDRPVYVQGSGANTTLQIEAIVSDGIGQPIRDPQSGNVAFNNIRAELISTGPDPGRLIAINAAGQQVSGTSIALRTNSGIGNITYRAGTQAGQYLIRITADRADNNVDNGIQDPVVGETRATVSDGRLFSLTITSPRPNAILVNRVDESVEPEPGLLPRDPNGTYSLTVSVLATDREGNPIPEGTEIEFGLVDHPVVGYPNLGSGVFAISGIDGDPEEGGFNFHAPTGQFNTSAYPSGPGDTLLVFGKDVPGNRDLESARRIASNVAINRLTVAQRFNRNDDSGSILNQGPVLPYVIGRATEGNINARASTNAIGVATAKLNYPVSRLNKSVLVWARALTTDTSGNAKLVTDIAGYVYPGIAPLRLIASPKQIPANRTVPVQVCVEDAITQHMPGVWINFTITGASGSVDGQSTSGVVASPTGPGGCVIAMVTTTGVLPGDAPRVIFTAGQARDEVEIVPPGSAVLQAMPSAFRGDGTRTIQLTLLDGNGAPLRDVQLRGSCTTSGADAMLSIVSGPGVTDASGQTSATVSASGFYSCPAVPATEGPPPTPAIPARAPVTGTCTFSGPGGSPSTVVQVSSVDGRNLGGGVSPAPPTSICPS
jgi:hypothetical protein